MKQDRSDPSDRATPKAGDVASVDVSTLWRAHRHWVAAVLHAHRPRRAGSPDLEDLLQEVAMVLVRKQDELCRVEAIEPWLRTVAVNVARDAGRRVTAAGKLDPLRIAERRSGEANGGNDDLASRARSAMQIVESLPMTYSEPLMLSLRGLSYRQVSAVMDLPESTIQNRLFRARNMVRDELDRRAEAPALRLAEAPRNTSHG